MLGAPHLVRVRQARDRRLDRPRHRHRPPPAQAPRPGRRPHHPHPACPRRHPARPHRTLRHRRRRAAVPGHLGPRGQGGILSGNVYGRIWQKARAAALTRAQQASPLAGRPYDLRHGGVTLASNAGVPSPRSPAAPGTAPKSSGGSTPAASTDTSRCGTSASALLAATHDSVATTAVTAPMITIAGSTELAVLLRSLAIQRTGQRDCSARLLRMVGETGAAPRRSVITRLQIVVIV